MKKAFVSCEQRKRFSRGLLVPIVSVIIVVGFVIYGVGNVSRSASQERLKAAEQSVARATVQCYAIEGRYPPSVEYLEEHYGIVIDRDRYHVFYDGWASNVMPDITVLPAEPDSQEKEGTS